MAKKVDMKKENNSICTIIAFLLLVIVIPTLICLWVGSDGEDPKETVSYNEPTIISYSMENIPLYSENMDKPYVLIDDNIPNFSDIINELDLNSPFEIYSELDEWKRCGVAIANVCKETMPTEPRQNISKIRPSGWQDETYIDRATGKERVLYNRCHLIAHSLVAENANVENLITGTAYMNNSGMRVFENKVKNYIDSHENDNPHVLYRVTPIFSGDELVCRGVHMEAMSYGISEDQLKFNVYVYNVQKGVVIDYATGKKIE